MVLSYIKVMNSTFFSFFKIYINHLACLVKVSHFAGRKIWSGAAVIVQCKRSFRQFPWNILLERLTSNLVESGSTSRKYIPTSRIKSSGKKPKPIVFNPLVPLSTVLTQPVCNTQCCTSGSRALCFLLCSSKRMLQQRAVGTYLCFKWFWITSMQVSLFSPLIFPSLMIFKDR